MAANCHAAVSVSDFPEQWSGSRQHLLQHRPAFRALLLRLVAHPRIAPTLRAHRAT